MANGLKCIHCGHDEGYHFHAIGPTDEDQADEKYLGFEHTLRTCPGFTLSERGEEIKKELEGEGLYKPFPYGS